MSRLPPAPTPPRPPARTPFPLIAVIAPVVGAVAIGAIMRSPFVLVFAILSPLIALATMIDGRRQARVHRRAEAARFDRECLAFDAAITAVHREEAALALSAALDTRAVSDRSASVVVGTAPDRSAVASDISMPLDDDAPAERLRALLARAAVNPELPALVPKGAVTVVGRGLAADAVARRWGSVGGVVVHRRGAHDAATTTMSPDEQAGTVMVVQSATRMSVRQHDRVVDVRTRYDSADGAADDVGAGSDERRGTDELATHVSWASIAGEYEHFAVPVGRDAHGVVAIDLVDGGPHAIIGGTTGSGKSELLRSLALGWAAAASPMRAQLLFVDFKGGATFTGLTELPHCAGVVTDLDGAGALRVLQSLGAEVRRRERLLADHGARDVRECPDVMPRLLVLIDEYAAMLESHPELAPLIADLAARGRSLGVHLVVCTQSPSTAVRDAVAANCPVRVSFRVTEPSAAGFLGRAAPELIGVGPGRALAVGVLTQVETERRQPTQASAVGLCTLQVAVVTSADIDQVRERWSTAHRPPAPWLPPLPRAVDRSMVEHVNDDPEVGTTVDDERDNSPDRGDVLLLGLGDRPDEQRRSREGWNPHRDGPLAVVGAPRSGKSSALAAIARSGRDGGFTPVVVSGELPDAWASLDALRDSTERVVLLMDDLDLLVARSRDAASDLLDLWDEAVMAVLDSGGAVAASLSPAAATRGALATRLSSTLLLRTADAEQHVLLGGARGTYDRDAPPGRGWWAGRLVQVVREREPLEAPQQLVPAPWHPAPSTDIAIVCRHTDRVAAMLHAEDPQYDITTDLMSAVSSATSDMVALQPRAFLGTPAAWHSAWSSLQAWRARSELVIADVPPVDARLLLGTRGALPPLDVSRGDVWLVSPGEGPRRRRWAALARHDNAG